MNKRTIKKHCSIIFRQNRRLTKHGQNFLPAGSDNPERIHVKIIWYNEAQGNVKDPPICEFWDGGLMATHSSEMVMARRPDQT
jgi:hypothetical protein